MDPIVIDKEIDIEEAKKLFHSWAERVVKWHLTTPAILFLESIRPLNFISSQAVILFQPLMSIFLNPKEVDLFARLMMERENLDRFITTIEEKDYENRKKIN